MLNVLIVLLVYAIIFLALCAGAVVLCYVSDKYDFFHVKEKAMKEFQNERK